MTTTTTDAGFLDRLKEYFGDRLPRGTMPDGDRAVLLSEIAKTERAEAKQLPRLEAAHQKALEDYEAAREAFEAARIAVEQTHSAVIQLTASTEASVRRRRRELEQNGPNCIAETRDKLHAERERLRWVTPNDVREEVQTFAGLMTKRVLRSDRASLDRRREYCRDAMRELREEVPFLPTIADIEQRCADILANLPEIRSEKVKNAP